jgi:hypothetical protein
VCYEEVCCVFDHLTSTHHFVRRVCDVHNKTHLKTDVRTSTCMFPVSFEF